MAKKGKKKAETKVSSVAEVIAAAGGVTQSTKEFRCAVCEQKYNDSEFEVPDERDCPLCDNRDSARRI
jgi:hypothetical protein